MSKFLCVLTSAVCATPSLTVRCLCKLCVFCLQEERKVVLHLLASICLMSEKIILSSSFYVVHLWTVKNICIFLKYERLGHFQNSMITVTVNSYSSIVNSSWENKVCYNSGFQSWIPGDPQGNNFLISSL